MAARTSASSSAARFSREPPRWLPFALAGATFVVLALTARAELFSTHTAYNHYALLAEAWLDGRLSLGGPPPAYTQFNDFALYDDEFYVSFPPLPAVLLLPFVALFGGAEQTPDGLVFLLVAACAPAVLFAALEALRRSGASARTFVENAIVAALLPLGTVFWFTAVQGTVWFAAHVVAVTLAAAFLWAAVGAERPALAGLFLGLAVATRPTLLFAAPFFLVELGGRFREGSMDRTRALRAALAFAGPLAAIGVILAAHNAVRFDDALEFGHRHLQVRWRPRMEEWGLFSLHYLGKNLGVALASTPFLGGERAAFAITGHGLALWITSPFYALALWPRAMPLRARRTFTALAVSAACVALPNLLYHNTGWVQFGYRFSNDFAVFLLAMLAVGRRSFGPTFMALAASATIVNAFGALSFARPGWEKYYRYDVRPDVYFEPD